MLLNNTVFVSLRFFFFCFFDYIITEDVQLPKNSSHHFSQFQTVSWKVLRFVIDCCDTVQNVNIALVSCSALHSVRKQTRIGFIYFTLNSFWIKSPLQIKKLLLRNELAYHCNHQSKPFLRIKMTSKNKEFKQQFDAKTIVCKKIYSQTK